MSKRAKSDYMTLSPRSSRSYATPRTDNTALYPETSGLSTSFSDRLSKYISDCDIHDAASTTSSVYPQDPLNLPEQLFTPSKADSFPSSSTSIPPFRSSSFNLLRRSVKNTRRNSEFSSRRTLQTSVANVDGAGVTTSTQISDHFRRLRQVDLFKVDNAVKNVNFLRDDCLDSALPSAGLGRDIEGINRQFEILVSQEAVRGDASIQQNGPLVMAELERVRMLNRSLRERNAVVEAKMEYNRNLYQLHCRRIKDEVVKDLLVMFKLMYTEDGRVTWAKRDSTNGAVFTTDNIIKVMNEMMKALDVLEKVVKSM